MHAAFHDYPTYLESLDEDQLLDVLEHLDGEEHAERRAQAQQRLEEVRREWAEWEERLFGEGAPAGTLVLAPVVVEQPRTRLQWLLGERRLDYVLPMRRGHLIAKLKKGRNGFPFASSGNWEIGAGSSSFQSVELGRNAESSFFGSLDKGEDGLHVQATVKQVVHLPLWTLVTTGMVVCALNLPVTVAARIPLALLAGMGGLFVHWVTGQVESPQRTAFEDLVGFRAAQPPPNFRPPGSP